MNRPTGISCCTIKTGCDHSTEEQTGQKTSCEGWPPPNQSPARFLHSQGSPTAPQGPISSAGSIHTAPAPQNPSQGGKRLPPSGFQSQPSAQRQSNVRREVWWAEKPSPAAADARPGRGWHGAPVLPAQHPAQPWAHERSHRGCLLSLP